LDDIPTDVAGSPSAHPLANVPELGKVRSLPVYLVAVVRLRLVRRLVVGLIAGTGLLTQLA